MVTDCVIRLREHPQPAILLVAGEIDTRTIARFRAILARAAARHDRLVVDLTSARFLSAAALAALDHHRRQITALLVTRDGPLTHPLRLAGLHPLLVYARRPGPDTDGPASHRSADRTIVA